MKKHKHLINLILYYKYQFILVTFLTIVGGFVSAFSLIGIMPIIDFAVGNESNNIISNYIFEFYNRLNLNINLINLGLFFLFLIIIKNLFLFIQQYYQAKLHFKIVNKLIADLYISFVNSSWPFFLSKDFGTLSNTLTKETLNASSAIESGYVILSSIIKSFFYFILACIISFKLTITIISLVFFLILPIIISGKFVYAIMRIHTKANNNLQKNILNTLNAIKLIIGFNKRNFSITETTKSINILEKTGRKATIIKAFNSLLNEPITIVLVVACLFMGIEIFMLEVSILLTLLYSINRLANEIQAVVRSRTNFKSAEPSLEQIYSLTYEANSFFETTGSKSIKDFNLLEIKNLSFSHHKNKESNILQNININITKGKMVSIVGESGSGKSTIIDLILNFYKDYSGEILINGDSIDKINIYSYRDLIGLIPQTPFLFNATILENIKWANIDATNQDIEEACKMANCYNFINKMKNKFNTVIGERGVKLSGGEAQRLCLARALIRKPKILILDEATSNLDSMSELEILKTIERLQGRITIIAVAHRLSTIKNSDIIYNLHKGKIIQSGTYKELMKNDSGNFYSTFKLQSL